MRLHLHIKFRAFGITWNEFNKYFTPPFDIPAIAAGKVLISERGVLLEVVE